MFRDAIRQLPSTQDLIGDWQVGSKIVHVTSQTKIARDDGAIKVGVQATVKGTVLQDGSVNATLVTVNNESKGHGDDYGNKFVDWVRGVGRHFGWFK